ncbi:LysR family transcriptional regulator [Denitrobaculum tricleocarpae]|uniref:LysR family transcriptional regulator n=1 Tax=Denitrobaculum tricleocarpae TaxID=2591009 RepID=A0A545TX97_9PROT|nr:LysR family transcriptional regulator [Denitrobaculum tricleocarpae]TQV81839.1 LysR family transcriptional regulator [Denitrobaculum tricleocarpae]
MKNLRRSLPPLASLLPFEAAARLGSITKAGAELGLTQAAISKQIRALEEDLGVALFERRNRAVHLTQEGRELGRRVSEAFESIGAFAEDLRQSHREGEVVLRSQLCEGLYWLLPRLSDFYQKHPEVPVRVSTSTRPISESEERFDLALQTSGRNSGNTKLAFTASDEIFPICSPKYLETLQASRSVPARQDSSPSGPSDRNLPLDIALVPKLRLLHHKVEPQDWIDWDAWLEKLETGMHVGHSGIVYDSYPLMIQAVLEGHGVALGWRRTIEPYLRSGSVLRPFAESLYLPDGLSIYRPAGWQSRKGTSVLLKWLESELS